MEVSNLSGIYITLGVGCVFSLMDEYEVDGPVFIITRILFHLSDLLVMVMS